MQILGLWFSVDCSLPRLNVNLKIQHWQENNKGVFLPYKLVKDVAYPIKPWFYLSFKCEKDGLRRVKTY
jgi:hypothetical protein